MRTLVLAFLLVLSPLALAHPGAGDHHHEKPQKITQTEAKSKAKVAVQKKVRQGKLDKRWLAIPVERAYQKSFGHGLEWVVELKDSKAKDKKKQILYVFVGLTGKILGVNFTGQ